MEVMMMMMTMTKRNRAGCTSIDFESRRIKKPSVQQGLKTCLVKRMSNFGHLSDRGRLKTTMWTTIRFCDTKNLIDQLHRHDADPRRTV